MKYLLSEEFTQIAENTGTIQNSSHVGTIEMSTSDTPDSGILIYPLQKVSFTNRTIYLRCIDGYAEARVLPFELAGEGGDSSSGSTPFDIRQSDSTSILIYSTDTAGKLHETSVRSVNPESTDAQLAALGESTIDLTDNTYQSTYRVTKTLCDVDPRQYLFSDLPLTQDLTDRCGKTWNVVGSPTFENGALKFADISDRDYIYTTPPELGTSDFTIDWWEYIDSLTTPALVEVIVIDDTKGKNAIDILYNSEGIPLLYVGLGDGLGWLINSVRLGQRKTDQWVHRSVVRSSNVIHIFENGTLFASYNFPYPISTKDCSLFIGNFVRKNRQFIGYISSFKFYVGLALLHG